MAQLKIPLDAQRFGTGMTWKDYVAQMGDTRAKTEDNYSKSGLSEDERKFFSGINQVKYVLMLAENWCGDAHRNSPLIAHIVDAMPGAELRVFLRDQNLDLTDCFLNSPIFASCVSGVARSSVLARAPIAFTVAACARSIQRPISFQSLSNRTTTGMDR